MSVIKALCVMCMQREGDPKNGGLCYTCAPRGRVPFLDDVRQLRIRIYKVW